MDPDARGPVEAGRWRHSRLTRSIAQTQLLVALSTLFLLLIAVFRISSALTDVFFFSGVVLVIALTALSQLVPWDDVPKRLVILLPLLDIVAISLVREGISLAGSGLFLVLPVLWLARNFHLVGAIAGPVLSTALLWFDAMTSSQTMGLAHLSDSVLLPATLIILSTMTYETSRRAGAQRKLLRHQNEVIDGAFARARRQERLLDEILTAVEFGVLAFDERGEVTLMNNAHRRSIEQFGATRSGVVHPIVYQADRATAYTPADRPFARAIAGQTFDNVVMWVGEPGHRQAALSVTSRPLTSSDGRRNGGVLVQRDVTSEVEAIRTRDELVGSVSHELNTPLTSIIGYLELAMDDETLAEDTRQMIGIAHRNAGRMLGLVTDLLQAGSDSAASLSMSFERCDLVEIARSSIDTQALAASARGLTVTQVFPAEAPTSADASRIRQVVDNLMSNAIKYNRPGGSIVVSIDVSDETVSLTVRDTGFGISAVDKTRLFDRFYRTESARRSSTTGTGLGLSICREIVKRHGGRLLVESEPGEGSEFEMRLPAFFVSGPATADS